MSSAMFMVALNLIAGITAVFLIYHGADWATCTFGMIIVQVLSLIWLRLVRICELLESNGQ
jgi:hypothetical protein